MCSKLYQHDYNLYSYPCSFSATSSVQPRTWQGGRGEQDVYGNPRPFQYMRALRPTDPQIYPNVSNQVQVESPTSYQPRSNIPTNRPMETSLVQPRAHRNNLVAKPRSFDISLRIPFAHSQTSSCQKASVPQKVMQEASTTCKCVGVSHCQRSYKTVDWIFLFAL